MTALRILHVDDEADIREVVKVSLALDPGLVTRGCASGQEALTVVAGWPPDLVLLDAMMPGMDGATTLARLRENAETAAIPVVFMTARVQTREIEVFRSLGAIGVMSKPFDPMALAAAVRAYIRPMDRQLDTMRKYFFQRVSEDAASLVQYRSALSNGSTAPATLRQIRDIAHGLAGAGGIFGCFEISTAAAALEETVIGQRCGIETVDGVANAVDRLLAHVETAVSKAETAR